MINDNSKNIKLSIWMEGNKIYFKTYNNFKFTCIKIHFESELDSSNLALNQYNGNSILNPIGDYPWSVIPNDKKKIIFFFGSIDKAISSDTNSLFYILNSKNSIIKVSNIGDDKARSVDTDLIYVNN